MVVHGQHFRHDPPIMQILRAIHDKIHHLSGLFLIQVVLDQIRTAARIDQVIEANARDALLFQQIEYAGNLLHVHPV
jgi:hypothetical protein